MHAGEKDRARVVLREVGPHMAVNACQPSNAMWRTALYLQQEREADAEQP